VPYTESKASYKKRAKEWDMNEENESEDDGNYDKAATKNINKNWGRKSSAKKGLFSYNNGDDIEDSDTEDIFEL
jgi:hypothetical protein